MASVPFLKVEGLGNDFVVVDLRPGKPAADAAEELTQPDVVKALCDRHFGVGADGVLAILPSLTADARMRVLNADGNEAEMCGNGLRCVAKVLFETDASLRKPILRVETGAGLLNCSLAVDRGLVTTVTVDMGRPRLLRSEIPMTGPSQERALRVPLSVAGRSLTFTGVSMGNPHAVFFVTDPAVDLTELAMTLGAQIETSPVFPKRTNVEFARVRNGTIELVVWERGSGYTLACGTGACATAVAACLEGLLPPNQEIPVHLPGGLLHITAVASSTQESSSEFSNVKMRGPATIVFNAQIDWTSLLSQKLIA